MGGEVLRAMCAPTMGILVLTAALAEGDEEKDMSSIVVLIKRIACPATRACSLNAGGCRFAAQDDAVGG